MTCEELLQIASRIGRGLLESGAEAYRVENSVHYVIEAYDLGSCHVFSIPNYLHIDLTDQDGVTHSCMSRASSMKSVDLRKTECTECFVPLHCSGMPRNRRNPAPAR